MDKYYDEKVTFDVYARFAGPIVDSATRYAYHKKGVGPVVRYRGKWYDLFGGEFSRSTRGHRINLTIPF